ncbi:ATP-binding protein [Methanoculleus taiwanensis]|uniref:ATP-binding protein n=1 Tax=Methanoculleus taiwanensis TaxID=1550565 RepID=A0A498GYF6_9EURY|nr:cell division ATPase MinD [Methanoculleus taiwanensis]RXE55448.1 ATP-binding protein [Methanoculleus taiwanensis]
MVYVYTIASGKGGTGKTTVTANLGPMLAKYGKKTCILDADVGMANLGLILGLENLPVTLHEVLGGKASVRDAIYDGPLGVKVVPSGLSLQGFQNSDPDRLRDVMSELVGDFDVMLIDAPAGISRDGIIPLTVADGVVLVVNPEISSIVDALKTKILTETVGGHIEGAILNRVTTNNDEFNRAQMEKLLGVRILGIIPEDPNVRRASAGRHPIVVKYPSSDASRAFRRISAGIAGIESQDDELDRPAREGFVDRLARTLFRGKR